MSKTRLIKLIFMTLLLGLLGLFCAQWSKADTPEDELFLVAQKAYEDGFYDVAIRYVEQFQQKFSASQKNVQAKLLLGQCYFFKNQYLKAFEIFQSLSQYTEFRDATLFWLSETYFKGGDFKQAEKNYLQLINTYPNSSYIPQALYSLAWTYFEQTNYLDAKNTFAKLITRFPAHLLNEEAAFKMGECSHNAAEHETAIKIYKDFILIYPQSPRISTALFFIAESYYALENYLSAVNFYAQSADKALEPKIAVLSKLGLGWSYLKLQKFDLAKKAFEEAEKIAEEKNIPSDDVIIGLATLYADAQEHQKAGEMYQKLITKFPQSLRVAEAYLGKANCDYAKTDYASAVTNYKSLIEAFSKDDSQSEIIEKAYYGLAWTYLKSGKTQLAIESFQDIVNRSTNKTARSSALTQIGDAYQEIDQLDKAVEVYDQVLRDYSDTIFADYAQYKQGIALLKSDKISAATLSFQSLQTNFPRSKYLGDAKYYLALAHFKRDEWAQSILTATAYMDEKNGPNNFAAEATYLTGLANFNLGKYEQALSVFQKLTKNYQNQKSLVEISELYTAKSLFALGKTKEAIEKFNNIIKSYPDTDCASDALLWLGDYYLDEGKYPLAIQFYNQLIASFPNSEKINLVYYELGQSYQAAGQFDEALNAYKRVSENSGKEIFARARIAIADIFSKDIDPQTAIATYQNIAQTIPEFKKDALLRIAEVYKNNNDHAKAVATYEEALLMPSIAKSDAAALQFEIGDAYELMHNSNQAIEAYLKIPYLYPDQKDWVIKSNLRLARIFEDSSQWDQAVTIYNKILELNTDESKYAKERLEWISTNAKRIPPETP